MEDTYVLDRFRIVVCLCGCSSWLIMRNNYYAEVTNRHLIFKYTAEEDEVFESNSEQQDKRRVKNEPQETSKPPEEVSLNSLEL